MKKYILLMAVVLVGLTGYAQENAQEELAMRIETLERKVAQQDAQLTQQSTQLSQMANELEELRNQNLEMKKNLNLKKPKSKGKVGDLEFRIIEVAGNPDTRDVQLTMVVDNIGDTDKKASFWEYEIVDEVGSGYQEKDRVIMKVDGISDDLGRSSLDYHVNTPLTVKTEIKKYRKDANYLKYLGYKIFYDSKFYPLEFTDLPINWVEED